MQYQINNVDSKKVEDEAREMLLSLKKDEGLRKQAAAAGISLAEFDKYAAQVSDADLIKVETKGSGVVPGVMEVVIILRRDGHHSVGLLDPSYSASPEKALWRRTQSNRG